MKSQPVIVVTGGSRGIGAAVGRWLGKVRASIVLVARSENELMRVVEEIEVLGGTPLAIPADVSDPEACRNVIEQTVAKFGRMDALVNNAGIFQPVASIADADAGAWKRSIEVNLIGPFYMTKFAIPELRKSRGRVVNVSSGAAVVSIKAGSSYCAAKAGLNHFTAVLAEEEPDITCILMRPGVVDTHMQAVIRQEGPGVMPTSQIAYYQSLKDKGELEPPEVPARAIAWLSLYATKAVSGQFLDYDDPMIRASAMKTFGDRLYLS